MILTRTPPARAIETLQAEPTLVRRSWQKTQKKPYVLCFASASQVSR